GIARDLAAAGLGRLKPFDTTPLAGTFASPTAWRRDLPADAADACPFVAGRTFRNLRNGPSPEWAQQRLKAIGLRPISALVDITNLLTYDLGRPLHVFDAGKIRGDLTMRLAQDGEEVLALDGRTYRLDDGAIVIADQTGVHGIGGIMGGAGSGCSETTTEAFLEVALFDPVRVAATGRRLGIESDARYRFERGVDPQSAVWGAEVAARLILEWCGGEASQVVTAGTLPQPEQVVSLRGDRVATLGGGDVPAADQARILTSLGFDAAETKPDATAWRVPSWRSDIDGEADLVEEVLRVWGLDRITPVSVVPGGSIPGPAVTAEQRRLQVLRRVLAARGLYEAVTWSFTGQAQALTFGGGAAALRLVNPISADLDAMRPSLLVNLLAATGRNLARGQGDFGLFEVGPQYGVAGSDNDLMAGQMTAASGVRCGVMDGGWAARPRPVDLYDAKADALAALEALGAPVASLQTRREAPAWYHPGRSAVLALGPQVLAAFGDIHPDVAAAFDLAVPATLFEVYADRVPGPRRAKTASGAARPPLALSPYQPVTRDFAFVVAADVAAESLIRAARGADRDLISEVRLFDVYQGAELGDGKVSLAIAVTLQPMTATLTDKEIEAVAARVVAAVEKATGGRLRR
ncbi:MAG: phenylalanine--tRNA ligase subunit beta, partial [Alphaproteobacteria bacterium]